MKAYYKVILTVVIACAAIFQADAQVYVSDTLTENTTWFSAQNPYIVVEDIVIPKGITLTILPGVIIRFNSKTSIIVNGTIVARGSETNHILFTENASGVKWNGIRLISSKTQLDSEGNYLSGTTFSYSRFEGSVYTINIGDSSSVLVEKCEIDSCTFGIYLKGSRNNIRNCTISNSDFGVFFPTNSRSCLNRISGNVFYNNLNVGLFMNNGAGSASNNIIERNKFDRNPIGIHLGNDGPDDAGHNIVRNNTIINNSIVGLRLYQDSTEISNNIFYGNGIGISIIASKFSRVLNNLILLNLEWGVIITGNSGHNAVESNNIYGNLGGVLLTGRNGDSSRFNSISRNAIHNNQGTGVRIESAPQAGIQFNNLYDNGADNSFVNSTQATIHAEYNWWGTTDTLLINRQIFDVFDNPNIGHVIYKPYAGAPGSTSPISAPRNVVKRLVGSNVEIVWTPNEENDLLGYRFYYNYLTPYAFSDNIDLKDATKYITAGLSISDTIAVTAYDTQADGINDQLEGHESAFSYALAGPYAGADTAICNDNSFLVSGSTAIDYSSLSWVSSGDGSFDNNSILHPLYSPGLLDIATGEVKLMLTVINSGIQMTDDIRLILNPGPVAKAGADAVIVEDSALYLSEANANYFRSLVWTTSGDGQFSNENLLNPVYFPGMSDINAGQVTLTLKAFSPCDTVSDHLTLHILPSYSISGKVHAGNMPLTRGTLTLLRKSGNSFEQIRSGQIMADGTFHLGTLTAESYLVYVAPDALDYPGYLPTYYVGQITWKEAYLLPLFANTFDLDIHLVQRDFILPAGDGSISGTCYKSGGGSIIQSGEQNLTVLLLDAKGSKTVGYINPSADGTFVFPNLPYGEYILQAEKAGFGSERTPLIQLTPLQPDISGVQIYLSQEKQTIAIQLPFKRESSELNIYPNPANDLLHVTLPENAAITGFSISDATGRILQGFSDIPSDNNTTCFDLDIKKLVNGYYLLNAYNRVSAYHCRFLKL